MTKVAFSPFADEWGQDYRALLCSSERITLTAVVRGFIRDAREDRVKPILGTSTAAHLGWFVADELRFSGGLWVVRGEDGAIYDGRSGYRLQRLQDLWEKPLEGREKLWSFRELAPTPGGLSSSMCSRGSGPRKEPGAERWPSTWLRVLAAAGWCGGASANHWPTCGTGMTSPGRCGCRCLYRNVIWPAVRTGNR